MSLYFLSKLELQDSSKYCAVTDTGTSSDWRLQGEIDSENEKERARRRLRQREGERGRLSARKDVTREMTFPSILNCPLYTLNDLS